MTKHNVVELVGRASTRDELTEPIRSGASRLIKEALEVENQDGIRGETQSRRGVLLDLKARGFSVLELAVGDGALGFRSALDEAPFPTMRQQRCRLHKTDDVLNALPKNVQPKAKAALHDI